MKNVNVKLEKVSYEKVMGMKEQMMIKKNGMVVLILGWDKMREKKYEGDWREVERKEREDFIIFLDGGENIEIELFIEKNPPKRLTRPEARGLRHLAFRVDDIYKSVEELKKRGIETEEIRIDPLNGKHMTFFFDPDGLPLELHE